eukprot:1144934-Pelagomonas_calceolata.AAC.1
MSELHAYSLVQFQHMPWNASTAILLGSRVSKLAEWPAPYVCNSCFCNECYGVRLLLPQPPVVLPVLTVLQADARPSSAISLMSARLNCSLSGESPNLVMESTWVNGLLRTLSEVTGQCAMVCFLYGTVITGTGDQRDGSTQKLQGSPGQRLRHFNDKGFFNRQDEKLFFINHDQKVQDAFREVPLPCGGALPYLFFDAFSSSACSVLEV